MDEHESVGREEEVANSTQNWQILRMQNKRGTCLLRECVLVKKHKRERNRFLSQKQLARLKGCCARVACA